ncbi:MAG: NADH-quinone oxidoreductase subunit NuoH [Planctomycetota bacterium]
MLTLTLPMIGKLAITDVATTVAAAAPAAGTNQLRTFLTGVKPEFVPAWAVPITAVLLAVAVAMGIVSIVAAFGTLAERKVSGHIQCRNGPMRAGWHGILQPLADGVKLMLKEDMIPIGADKILFLLSPSLVLGSLLGAMAVFPLAPDFYFADIDLGIFAILALTSTTTIGVIMAGWSSNSKWSLYGAMREAAQVVAYEIPLGISLLVPLIVCGTFNLIEVSDQQAGWFGMGWYIFRSPMMIPAFVLFFIAILAETKRAPFDLPEAESELVAGFLTEYSGIRWSFFFMEEYAAMFLFSAVGAFFFFGGFESPLTWGARAIFAETGAPLSPGGTPIMTTLGGQIALTLAAALGICVKASFGLFLMMWIRWTLPRIRIDQVMTMGYKYLTPLSLLCVLVTGVHEALIWPSLLEPWWPDFLQP